MIAGQLRQGYYQASGTVLLRKEASRGGRSLLLFLRGFGPLWAGAPSAGGKNRFGGGAEPMVWGSFSLYQSPSRLYLQSVDVKEDFLQLRGSPAALACAARLYRLTADEAPSGCENDGLLRALWSAAVQLRAGALPAAVEFRYMWKLLAVMGTAPSLGYCAGCGEKTRARRPLHGRRDIVRTLRGAGEGLSSFGARAACPARRRVAAA